MDNFPKYSSVGCYPLLYLDRDYNVYCASCAKEAEEDEPGMIVHGEVNWESPNLFCDCGEHIESAYAEDD